MSENLLQIIELGRIAIGDHFAPNDCYATGPLTGNIIEDLVVCPACRFIHHYDQLKARLAAETEGVG